MAFSPLDDRGAGRLASPKPPVPGSNPDAKTTTFYAGATRLAETAAPNMKNRSFSLMAEVEIPDDGAEGVIFAIGGVSAGMVLYVDESRPVFHYNWFDENRDVVKSKTAIPAGKEKLAPGKHKLVYDFKFDGGGPGTGGTATLAVDGTVIETTKYPRTIGYRISLDETLDIGEDTGTPVSEDYKVPFKFSGEIEKVTIDLK